MEDTKFGAVSVRGSSDFTLSWALADKADKIEKTRKAREKPVGTSEVSESLPDLITTLLLSSRLVSWKRSNEVPFDPRLLNLRQTQLRG
ncbi:MAG: hypothetical protein QME66_03055 [Candidatus Eisenbacteria bacterium]|nr:hypothetical protein [Candidatus Eisenbacteria bacterium]